MRIAMINDPEIVNANYRAHLPLFVLGDRGHELRGHRREERLGLPALLTADVVHIHRIAAKGVAAELRDAGVGIVWDNDDTTAVTKGNPLYTRLGGFKGRELLGDVKAMMSLADVVTTPSPVLADQYRKLGARDVRVIENYLPREFAKVRPAKHSGIVVVWTAALEHQVDYERLGLRATLGRLLDEHADLHVRTLGLNLGLGHQRYEHVPATRLLDLAKHLARCDVGIAPLTDVPFNRARSNIKLKEYGSAGLAWLASPIGPYEGLGEEQGGRLVGDDDWHPALERLIADARGRRRLAKRAARWAKGQYVDQHADRWETALRDAAEGARARRIAERKADCQASAPY